MAAGSVRLPELRQDIKVDTRDLARAEAAARRFKQAMSRNLQIDESEFDKGLAGIDKKLRDFQDKTREIRVKTVAEVEDARKKIQALGREKLRVKLEMVLDGARRQIQSLSRTPVRITPDINIGEARQKIRDLGRRITIHVDADTKEAQRKLDNLIKRARKIDLFIDIASIRERIRALSNIKVTIPVDADTTLARAKIRALRGETVIVRVEAQVDEARRRIDALSTSARNSVRSLSQTSGGLSNLSGAARGAAKALGLLSIAGVVGGALGVLAGGAVGLASALNGAVPAALTLAGGLGGLAVTAGGLAAIFKSNEGLKGSSEILRQAFEGIQDDLQNRVNPSILNFMRSVAGLAPIAREMVPPFADAFIQVTEGFNSMIRDSTFQNDLRQVLTDGIDQFRLFGEGGRNALQGIISLAAATGPHITNLASGFVDVTAQFRNWVNEARRTGELNILLQNSFNILESLGTTVANLAVGFKNMFMAANFSGFTQSVLDTLEGIGSDFRTFTQERAADMAAMFDNLRGQVEGFRPLIGSLANGIREILTNIDLTPLMRGIQEIIPELAAGLTEFTNALARVAENAAPAINSLLGLIRGILPDVERVVTTVVRNVTQVVNAVRPGIERFTEMLANIGDDVLPVIAGAARNLGAAFSTAMIVIGPLGEILGGIVGLLGDMSGAAGLALTGLLAFSALRGVFGGATQGANRLWQGINNLATGTTNSTRRIGVLRGALQGLARPFAQAVVGTRNLGTGFRNLGESMQVQRNLAQQTGQAYGRLSGTLTALQNTSSGVLRGMGQIGQAFVDGQQRARGYADTVSTAAGTVTRVVTTGMATPVIGSINALGSAFDNSAGRLLTFAGNADTAGQRVAAGLGGAMITAGERTRNFGTVVGQLGTTIAASLGNAVTTAAGHFSRLGTAASGVVSGGFAAFGRGLSGLIGVLGGGWGIAITAAVGALAAWGQASQEAAQQNQALVGALEQSGGAMDANVQKVIEAQLAQDNANVGLQQYGTNQAEVAQKIMEGGAAYDQLVANLRAETAERSAGNTITANVLSFLGEESSARYLAANAVEDQNAALETARQQYEDNQNAMARNNDALGQGRQASIELGEAMKTLGDETATAADKTDALKTAMDAFRGGTRDAQDAAQGLNDAIRGMEAPIEGFNAAMIRANGTIDTTSEAGSQMRDRLNEVTDAALESATAAFDAAGGTQNLAEANAAASGEIQKARDSMIGFLQQAGLSEEQARKVADALGLIPAEVTATLNLENTDVVQQQLTQVKNQLDQLPVNTPLNIDVPLAPQTIQKLEEIGVKVTQIPGANGQPARIELTVPTEEVQRRIPEIIGMIENPTGGTGPGGIPAMPADANMDPAKQTQEQHKQATESADPTRVPTDADIAAADMTVEDFKAKVNAAPPADTTVAIGGDTNPLAADAETGVGNVETRDPALLGVGGDLIVEREVEAFVGRLNAYQMAILPIGANIEPGETAAEAWVARINGYQAAVLPINANVQPGEATALAWVERIKGFQEATLPINADVAPGEATALAWVERIKAFPGAILPINGNIDPLNQVYAQAYDFITTNEIVAPIWGDFSPLLDLYRQVVAELQATPIVIPIYGQFMGIQGLPGMGGGMGMASGGILGNDGPEFFAQGGMSAADRMAMKAVGGRGSGLPQGTDNLAGMATAKGMGLTPMDANSAAIVGPNTWRVIGDRAKDDESYIPINNSPRSVGILDETARRMGFAIEKMARGGQFNAASQSASSAEYGSGGSPSSSTPSQVQNHYDAPLIGGDLQVVVPQDTPIQDAFAEVQFALRRTKRGGVHRRSPAKTGR